MSQTRTIDQFALVPPVRSALFGLTLGVLLPFSCLANHAQQPRALGSLTKIGEVYVNDAQVTEAESTIFEGDKLRTGENGIASFAVSGRGTLKFSPNTFVVFAGTDQYVADLRSGTVVVSSFSGPSGLAVRIGDFLVLPAVQDVQTTTKIERAVAGNASVNCLEGSASVISSEGAAGLLLQAGQSSAISASGQLNPEATGPGPEVPPPSAPSEAPLPPQSPSGTTIPPTTTATHVSHKGWIILGLAGGAGAAAIAGIAAGGGGHHPVSPSSP